MNRRIITKMLWIMSLLLLASVAYGQQGGVLFYAGFDGTRDAQAVGDGAATPRDGGASLTADGFGFRGCALRTGDGEGYLEYAAEGNIRSEEGTIEFWMYADDWEHNDGFLHHFVDVRGEGGVSFHMTPDGVQVFGVRGTAASAPTHWEQTGPALAQRAYGSGRRQGEWTHYILTWKPGEPLGLYIGNATGDYCHNASNPSGAKAPLPGKLTAIYIGDFSGGPNRNAHTLIDEFYVYDRALTYEEACWTHVHRSDRAPGEDVPVDFAQPTIRAVPDPEQNVLGIEVDTGKRITEFGGVARLEPAAGTQPAQVHPLGERYGRAEIPYTELPEGTYRIVAELTDAAGNPLGSPETELNVPPPPTWLGNKLGISDTPPPPWPPLKASETDVEVWGRRYGLGDFGLPAKIITQGKPLLAGPITLTVRSGGEVVDWTGNTGEIVEKNANEVQRTGTARSSLGAMQWSCQAEFDGMIRYDFELQPAEGATVDLMELRVPLRQQYAPLYYMAQHARGELPAGEGTIWKASWQRYWWIGDESLGLCAFMETDEAWPRPNPQGIRIERGNGAVTVVYTFVAADTPLEKPWKLTWGLQATPVKPRPANWRLARGNAPGANIEVYWPGEAQMEYFTFPSPRDPEAFKKFVDDYHQRGLKHTPYSGLSFTSPVSPEFVWFQKYWDNPLSGLRQLHGWGQYLAVRMVPSWIDFAVWNNHQIVKNYGTDGIYVDFSGVGFTTFAPEYGMGYVRNGEERPAWPLFATRELYKRIYTMLKTVNPDNLIIGHVSGAVHVPVLSFVDIWLDGEGNWRGQLKDNYLDVIGLDELRAEWMCHQYGSIPWFLPQWSGAVLEDKDVAERFKDHPSSPDGAVRQVSVEKSHHLFGLGLLHDFGFWPICGTNPEASEQYYGVLDEFGIGDARFFGYWDNAWLIGGQTDAVKASAYRKPDGGGLVVIYNVTREPQQPTLIINWERLKSPGELEVVDAYTKEPVEITGNNVTIQVPPLNYRLLWVH